MTSYVHLQKTYALIQQAGEASRARGWWTTPVTPFIVVKLALIFSELAEAAEHAGFDTQDDKLPQFEGYLVEMADVAIRLGDLLWWMNINVLKDYLEDHSSVDAAEQILFAARYNDGKGFKGTYIEFVMTIIGKALECDRRNDDVGTFNALLAALLTVMHSVEGLHPVIDLKMSFNLVRVDHNPEVRAQVGGKKY